MTRYIIEFNSVIPELTTVSSLEQEVCGFMSRQ